MKRNFLIYIFAFLASFVFFSCEEEEIYETLFKGTVINAIDHKPFPNLEVSITNGESTYKTTHTDALGDFSILVRSKEINSSYYLLVGDSSCAPVKKELRGLGKAEIDLGVIEVEGPKAPVVSTDTVYSHKAGTVICRGTVVDGGRASILERGFCWSLKENPSISDAKKQSDTNGDGEYEISIDELKLGTTYYFKAYAKNRIGISYGEQIAFKTGDGKASVETDSVYAITATSAKCAGNVTGDGDYAITKRGICWALTTEPEIADFVAYDENPCVGPFVCSLRNLTPSTPYYVRAFATNESGATTYGEVKQFNTKDGKPTVSTGTPTYTANTITIIGSTVIDNGGYAIDDKGICYSTSSTEPTTAGQKVSCGKGNGSFDVTIDNLDAGTTYYLRAYAENEKGTSYGEHITVKTSDGQAAIEIGNVSNITVSSANCTVKITSTGGATVQSCGICWSTNPSPTINGNKAPAGGKQPNTEYLCKITGLDNSTTYYIRAYVTTNISTEYSEQSSFRTNSGKPTVLTSTNYEAGENYLIISGSRDTEEGAPITRQGICWSTISNPTISDNPVDASNVNANPFSCRIEGLESGTTYYCRAFAQTSYGIGYGQPYPFTTEYGPTTLTGHVYDQDGNPISGASVSGYDVTGYSATTDNNGYYSITLAKRMSGSYQFSASADNYNYQIKTVSITRGAETQQDFTITLKNKFAVDFGTGLYVNPGTSWEIYFECNQTQLPGQTTTRNMRIKNYRSVPVTWSVTNIPTTGITFSKSSGTIPALGEVSITVTFRYPSTSSYMVSLPGCSSGSKTYIWNWDAAYGGYYVNNGSAIPSACNACCWQNPIIMVDNYTEAFTLLFNQGLVWN